jgi:hypothetical protein
MNGADVFGYVASILVFGTFYMKRMMPLRLTAIASNLAFISYAWAYGLTPILVLHGALLPLNIVRLIELHRPMAKEAREAHGRIFVNRVRGRNVRPAWQKSPGVAGK